MKLDDTWCDANLYSVFHALCTSTATLIPNSWLECMESFAQEFEQAGPASPDLVAAYNLMLARGYS